MIVVTIAELAQSYIAQARSSGAVEAQLFEQATEPVLARADIVACFAQGSASDFPPWLEVEPHCPDSFGWPPSIRTSEQVAAAD